MGWQQWPAWVKGGVILASLYTIVYWGYVIAVYAKGSSVPGGADVGLALILLNFLAFPVSFFAEPLLELFPDVAMLLLFVLGVVQWFIVGALAGWVLGMVRGKQGEA